MTAPDRPEPRSRVSYRRGPLRGYWIAPNRRFRARLWFDYAIDHWDEKVYEREWPEWCYLPQLGVLDRAFGLTCRVACHRPVDDHCGRPQHRYCEVCHARTPAGVTA